MKNLKFGIALFFWALLLWIEVHADQAKVRWRRLAFKVKYRIWMIAFWITTRIPPL